MKNGTPKSIMWIRAIPKINAREIDCFFSGYLWSEKKRAEYVTKMKVMTGLISVVPL